MKERARPHRQETPNDLRVGPERPPRYQARSRGPHGNPHEGAALQRADHPPRAAPWTRGDTLR